MRYNYTFLIYRWSSALCDCSFFCMCDVNYSIFLLQISVYIYVFHATEKTAQHGCVFDSVTVNFNALRKLSFLHMCLT